MQRFDPVANPTLEQYKTVFISANAAFNRGDFATAFASLAPDCEYRSVAYATERVLVGPEQVCRFFEQEIFGTFPDWQSDPVDFLQAGEGVFVALLNGHGTGSASGAETKLELGQVWRLREGIPTRVDEFPSWEEAAANAGVDLPPDVPQAGAA